MAFNKKTHLKDNVQAIKIAFQLDREDRNPSDEELAALKKYVGFGGLKCILNPIKEMEDVLQWSASDMELFQPIIELHRLIRHNTENEREYKRYINGLKSSVLTAFYTPPPVVNAIAEALKESGVTPGRFLDPSAGMGEFVSAFKKNHPTNDMEVIGFEKDPMTGKLLSHLYANDTIKVDGFETIEGHFTNYFDVISSNIPFGNVSTFDPEFINSKNSTKRQAAQSIHTYFFAKGLDTLREGGIMAFITSQGVMNTSANESIRRYLMERSNLVSAIRLPNDLFSDHAGTDVGSDLIVLQKNSSKGSVLTQREEAFLHSIKDSDNVADNSYIQQAASIIYTDAKIDTDPYGKPALVYRHSGGIDGITNDLKKMLSSDLGVHLDKQMYEAGIRYRETIQLLPNNLGSHLKDEFPEIAVSLVEKSEKETLQKVTGEINKKNAEQTAISSSIGVIGLPDEARGVAKSMPERESEKGNNEVNEISKPTVVQVKEEIVVSANPGNEPKGNEPIIETFSSPEKEISERQQSDSLSEKKEELREVTHASNAPLLSLYDLFGMSQEERLQAKPKGGKKKNIIQKGSGQGSLFSQPLKDDVEKTGEAVAAVTTSVPVSEESSFSTERAAFDDSASSEYMDNMARQNTPIENNDRGNVTGGVSYDLFGGIINKRNTKGEFPSYPIFETKNEEALNNRDSLNELAAEEKRVRLQPRALSEPRKDHYNDGSLIMDGEQVGYLKVNIFHPVDLSDKQFRKASLYIEMRDTYCFLYSNETQTQRQNPALRSMLNQLYDSFTGQYGELNNSKNSGLIKMDRNGSEMKALERFVDGKVIKADIFDHPVAFNVNEITHTDDVIEALAASLNKYADVNMEYISSITDLGNEEILKGLEDRVYYNPLIRDYEIAEKFLSGNVVSKAEMVAEILKGEPEDPQINKSLLALQNATPQRIPFSDIGLHFGERWIPTNVFSTYATWLFGPQTTVSYLPGGDEFILKTADRRNARIRDQFSVQGEHRLYDGINLMKHALHNTTPNITKEIEVGDDVIKVKDIEAIQQANAKIDEIRDGFGDWLQGQSPEFKERLTDLYNRKFNCIGRPKYDGSHLTFPGLDLKGLGIPDLYGSQKDAVWMQIANGGGIVDHEVGGGKTLIMCCAAHEMKRMKLINKPIIAGLKANIHEIAHTFATAYPNAKILYPGKEDFTPEGRKRIFNEMKNNDWDAIVLTHEQFGMIPQALEVQKEIIEQELESVEENLEVISQQGEDVSNELRKGAEKRKMNLEVKLKSIVEDIDNRKDDVVDFKQMAVDHLFIDESHRFKNLTFTTRHDRVAGLGNPEGSQRALNLLFALRTIQNRNERDLGATFFSGTTISNSLTELYLLYKYLIPNRMDEMGLKTFDAWAALFAKKSVDYEFSVTNEIKPKERFRGFKNVPELASILASITDYRTAEAIGIDRPVKNVIFHNIPPTPDQQDFTIKLMEFAKTAKADVLDIGMETLSKKKEKAIMLLATDLARKMSLDMRLIEPRKYDDHPDNKINHCAEKIAEYYSEYNEFKGSQFVFSDLGTYKQDQWTPCGELKQVLTQKYGIPDHEIRFIQEAKTKKQRETMIQDMNKGKIRVLVGSTEMLGTGVNAQERCVAIHHLDCPWRPSDLEQRDGRGVRKGNWVAKLHAGNKVDVIIYAVERTLDAYKFNLLHHKQTMISQIKNNSCGSRTIDEGGMDDQGGMNYSEYVAILSGDTRLLEKAKLDRKVMALDSEKKVFNRGKNEAQNKLYCAVSKVDKINVRSEALTADWNKFKSVAQFNDEGYYKNPVLLDGLTSGNPKIVGEKLNEINRNAKTNGEYLPIGMLYDFNLLVKTEASMKDGFEFKLNRFFVEGSGGIYYTYNNGDMATEPTTAARNFVNALEKIPGLIDKEHANKAAIEKDIPLYESMVNAVWNKEGELKELKDELKRLDSELQGSTNKEKTGEASVHVVSLSNTATVDASNPIPEDTGQAKEKALDSIGRLLAESRESSPKKVMSELHGISIKSAFRTKL